MKTTDEFSEHYQALLDGQYDCVDRIVLNAYFVLGQTPGGFRTWWRQLHGSDKDLTETMVMRYAGRFARRVRAYTSRQASYDLRKLRAKGVVKRIPKSLRYESEPKGLRASAALLVLRNKVLVPLLAKQGKRYNGPRCHMSPIDMHYDNIQNEMQQAFKVLGIAA